jgi:hypothetical protein
MMAKLASTSLRNIRIPEGHDNVEIKMIQTEISRGQESTGNGI